MGEGLRPLAYYMHPINSYDTAEEGRDIHLIEDVLGYEARNPNTQADRDAYAKRGGAHFAEVARGCDLGVLRAFPDGTISPGKHKEMVALWQMGKPVFELPTRPQDLQKTEELGVAALQITPPSIAGRVLDVKATRAHLGVQSAPYLSGGQKLLAYYAHPVDSYNTPEEAEDVHIIEQTMGWTVCNPNSQANKDLYPELGMGLFFELVRMCNVVVIRSFKDGYIGAGVWGEAEIAIEADIPVFELPTRPQDVKLAKQRGAAVIRLSLDAGDRVLDIAETRRYVYDGYRREKASWEVAS